MLEKDGYKPRHKFAPPDDRRLGTPLGGNEREQAEIHYDGTPTVTVRLVNGVQQDVPHLYVDSRGGQTRWWVERESVAEWQERVRAAKERGDERYKDISSDRIPSSITHNYPEIPPHVLQRHPEHTNREWVTHTHSLSPKTEGEIYEHTFLNTPPSPEDETTIFISRFPSSVKVDTWTEIPKQEAEGKNTGEGGQDKPLWEKTPLDWRDMLNAEYDHNYQGAVSYQNQEGSETRLLAYRFILPRDVDAQNTRQMAAVSQFGHVATQAGYELARPPVLVEDAGYWTDTEEPTSDLWLFLEEAPGVDMSKKTGQDLMEATTFASMGQPLRIPRYETEDYDKSSLAIVVDRANIINPNQTQPPQDTGK